MKNYFLKSWMENWFENCNMGTFLYKVMASNHIYFDLSKCQEMYTSQFHRGAIFKWPMPTYWRKLGSGFKAFNGCQYIFWYWYVYWGYITEDAHCWNWPLLWRYSTSTSVYLILSLWKRLILQPTHRNGSGIVSGFTSHFRLLLLATFHCQPISNLFFGFFIYGPPFAA